MPVIDATGAYAVVITPDADIQMKEMQRGEPKWQDLQTVVGGFIEIVRPRELHRLAPELNPVMLVDEDGRQREQPFNLIAASLYGGTILGTALICGESTGAEGPELASLTGSQAVLIKDRLLKELALTR